MSWQQATSRPPCPDLAEDRSALVDGALELGQQELMFAHLVHCTPCRLEVLELRRLRAALRTPLASSPPDALAQRLISIAGAEAASPLWTRPFSRTRPGSLTSPRRALRLRLTAAAVAVGATVTGMSMVGYVAAPPESMVTIRDPGANAQAEFSSMLAQLPLANGALGAVLATGPADLSTPVPVSGVFSATVGRRPLTYTQARAAMARAVSNVDAVSYTGLQAFRAESRGHVFSATVEVKAVLGQGIRSRVLNRSGRPVGVGFTPPASATRVVDGKVSTLLERNYVLSAWAGAEAAGRPATMVEARRNGRTAARWWVDDASGIVLAQQSFDREGDRVMQVGFTSVQITRSATLLAHLPTRLAVPTTDTALTVSAAPELDRQGWVCPESVGALSLVRLRSDSETAPEALHLVYSDGLATVSVFEQRGRLTSAPSGASWDAGLRAYVRDGASSLASWQSAGTVFTVVTDGSSELLAAAVASLPHEPPPERTTMDRIRAGWVEILANMKG